LSNIILLKNIFVLIYFARILRVFSLLTASI